MSGDHAAILKRIAKCMALASSANEHEAAAALAKAHELMREYNINAEELSLAHITTVRAKRGSSNNPVIWESMLFQMIDGLFGCEHYLSQGGGGVNFVGTEADAAVASYVFEVVFRLISRHRRQFIGQQLSRCSARVKTARADSFCMGWVRGVQINIACLVNEPRRNEQARAWMSRNLQLESVRARKAAATRSCRTDDDYFQGLDKGLAVTLHTGIGTSASTAPVGLLE